MTDLPPLGTSWNPPDALSHQRSRFPSGSGTAGRCKRLSNLRLTLPHHYLLLNCTALGFPNNKTKHEKHKKKCNFLLESEEKRSKPECPVLTTLSITCLLLKLWKVKGPRLSSTLVLCVSMSMGDWFVPPHLVSGRELQRDGMLARTKETLTFRL